MKFCRIKLRWASAGLLWVLCALAADCFGLDREAFTFTSYDLNVQVDPDQHRLGVRGKITLRNDSATPQKIAVLQISSSLDWKSIKAGDKALQFVTQPYTSDIDHTGSLSEAIVTLPQAVAPKGTIDLTIGYEGVIVLDATRLTRIGTPEDAAASTDWDRIDPNFTAVRGAGYVAWYPIATEVANLSEGNSLFEVLGRWKAREAEAKMNVVFESTEDCTILFSGNPDMFVMNRDEGIAAIKVFSITSLGANIPTFVVADFKQVTAKDLSTVYFFSGKEATAASYADVVGNLDPLPNAHRPREIQIVELPDSSDAPFVTEGMLLTPLRAITAEDRLTLVYALARHKAPSSRPWVSEGLAHFAQVRDIEIQSGRKAALDYLNGHRQLLVESEKQPAATDVPRASDVDTRAASRSLISTEDELYLRSKAMYVWWMLRDMVGDIGMNLALSSYKASEDKDPYYMERLIAAQTQRDLDWFFDDWVYRDRGLPDFKVESAFSRKTPTNSFMVTVTVDNLGGAGAEVPLTVRFAGGDITKRLEVRARSKASIRVEVPAAPEEIMVNDGSVPESDMTNNVFKMEAGTK